MHDVKILLIVEPGFYSSYLVSKWVRSFSRTSAFLGIAIQDKRPSVLEVRRKRAFHRKHKNQRELDYESLQLLRELYPDFGDVGQAMLTMFGLPPHSDIGHSQTYFLGTNLNSPETKMWQLALCDTLQEPPFVFIFIGQILQRWWLDITGSRVINGHPAVLPYARGFRAIEAVAASGDITFFQRAAGASVHFVDAGVDTGPIIRAQRITDPLQFKSIVELRAYSFNLVFDLMVQVADDLIKHPATVPVGVTPSLELKGPNFRRADSTPEMRARATEGYRRMREQHLASVLVTNIEGL